MPKLLEERKERKEKKNKEEGVSVDKGTGMVNMQNNLGQFKNIFNRVTYERS